MPTWTTIGTSTLTPVEMTKRKEVLVPLRRTDYTLLYHYGDLDKTPMRGVSYLATFVNGETRSGALDDKGQAQMCAVPAGAVTVSYQHEAANTDDANIILARDKVRKALDAIVAQTQTDMAREWQRWNEAGWLKRQYLETLKTYEGRTLGAWHWLSGTLEAVWQLAVLCCKLDKEELELAYLFSTGQWRALDEKIAGYRKKGRRMLAQASEAKELLNLVFHDQQTRTLITEFAKKWWEAIPPHERDEMVMDSGTQIIIDAVIGVLLAAFSAGAAGEAYGSAKWTAAGGRLGARVRELLDALKEAFEALARALKLRKRGMTEVTREANAERVIESKWKPKAVTEETIEASRAAGRSTANAYYKTLGWEDTRIASHMDGIDFSKPVEVVTLPKGTQIVQYQIPGNPVGGYFAPLGTAAESLGISSVGRQPNIYTTTENISVLRTTAADTSKNLKLPESARGTGGGVQFFTNNRNVFQPLGQ